MKIFHSQAYVTWKNVQACDCLKEILKQSGFDEPQHLYGLAELNQLLDELEENINSNKSIISNIQIDCSHINNYKTSQNFKFLPGHRIVIRKLVENQIETNTCAPKFEHPSFSILLQSLIQTAVNNYGKSSSIYRYPELLMDFAIYLYIMAGKACYEVIAANLPLPAAGTVCNNNLKIHN